MWDPERQQCLCWNRARVFLLSEVKSTLRITCICLFIRFLRIVFLCSLPQAQCNAGRWDYPVIKLTHCAAFQHFLYLISREGTPSLSHKAVPILLMGLYRISCWVNSGGLQGDSSRDSQGACAQPEEAQPGGGRAALPFDLCKWRLFAV